MTDKKKKYLAPEMNVIEVKAADIIATSTQQDFGIPSGTGYDDSTPW